MRAPAATLTRRLAGRVKHFGGGRTSLPGGCNDVGRFLAPCLVLALSVIVPSTALAQDDDECRFICALAWKVEPTFTIENVANRHRVMTPDGVVERAEREHVFET